MLENQHSILVVDDDIRICNLLNKALSESGYRVDMATDGDTALQKAADSHYDLAVLDYQMPKLNGVQLFERLCEQFPELAGVFLTGHPTIDTVFPAVSAGIQRVLAKPVDLNELRRVVSECLEERAFEQ